VVVKALNFVCDVNPSLDNISADVKLAFFNETRHAFGRTALLLSGGAGLGFYHVGFVKALFDQVRGPGAPPGSVLEDGVVDVREESPPQGLGAWAWKPLPGVGFFFGAPHMVMPDY